MHQVRLDAKTQHLNSELSCSQKTAGCTPAQREMKRHMGHQRTVGIDPGTEFSAIGSPDEPGKPSIDEQVTCPRCKASASPERIHCPDCGAPLAVVPPAATEAPAPRPVVVSPRARTQPDAAAGAPCPSCGKAPIDNRFCAHCGQERFEPHPPGALSGAAEFLREATHIGQDLLRTLIKLVVPGRLTLGYLHGNTVRHLSPMKLYIVAFAWLSLMLTQMVDANRPAWAPGMEDLESAAGWMKQVISFFLPLALIGVLRLIWGQRREHYPFALHSYAFLAFILLPAQGYFFHAGLTWTFVSAWRTYGRINPATKTRDYSLEGLAGRAAATTMVVCVVFLGVLVLLSLLELMPLLVAAWVQQQAAAMR
jgi:ribosomal protein L32